jgi:hypothetical protein
MKISATPEDIIEGVTLATGRAPLPVVHTIQAMWVARSIMVAPKRIKQTMAFRDLYYSLINEVSPRSFEQIAQWQQAAGLAPLKPFRLVSQSGIGQQAAVKPAG